MAKEKVQAAILGFLNDLEAEGVEQANEATLKSETKTKKSGHTKKEAAKRDILNENGTSKTIAYQYTEIDPSSCTPWKYANRLIVNEITCHDLIESMKLIGQKIPIIVRKKENSNTQYELICGARRLFACSALKIKVKAVIATLSDKEALLVMDAENREREDISPYERALEYKSWVSSGIFKNYKEAMEEAGFKKSWFSKLIALADLDPRIVKAFGLPKNIKQNWGYKIVQICKESSSLKEKLITEAKHCTKQSLSPEQVFRKLTQITNVSKIPKKNIIEIHNSEEKTIFTIEKKKNATMFKLPTLENKVFDEIIELLKEKLVSS